MSIPLDIMQGIHHPSLVKLAFKQRFRYIEDMLEHLGREIDKFNLQLNEGEEPIDLDYNTRLNISLSIQEYADDV